MMRKKKQRRDDLEKNFLVDMMNYAFLCENIKKCLIISFCFGRSKVMNTLKSKLSQGAFIHRKKLSYKRKKLFVYRGKTFSQNTPNIFCLFFVNSNNRKRVEQLWQHEKQQQHKELVFSSFLFHFCSFLSARLPFTHSNTYTSSQFYSMSVSLC